MGPVTTNPWLIALINMTIVFGVLIALGVLMNLLQVIDPTKKVAKPAVAPTPAAAPLQLRLQQLKMIAKLSLLSLQQ